VPNGGMLPCCRVCQYAQDAQTITSISCQRHRMRITNAFHTFCADLSHNSYPGLAAFIHNNTIASDQIYIWTEVQYRTTDHPTLPQYQHQFVTLTSIATYAGWTDHARQEATTAQTHAQLNAFEHAYRTPPKHTAWQRRVKAVIDRLRRKT
jgi:hypothetical protein